MKKFNLVKSSYSSEDVIVLLQDVEGKVPVLDTEAREKLNQSGVHYSEMLPLEYVPTDDYMKLYEESLDLLSYETAVAVAKLSNKLVDKKGTDLVIVSLARAGTPIGILVKRYIKYKYGYDVPHYTVSIIRGKGIDKVAMDIIVSKHGVSGVQFLDGWVGKGAINKVLHDACVDLESSHSKFTGLDSELAVLSDPASVTKLTGTTEDFLIPSACLNATVSGLMSRTVHIDSLMTSEDLHGAVYYSEYESVDKSNQFLDAVCKHYHEVDESYFICEPDDLPLYKGLDEVKSIANHFGIDDINKVKPGVGETTRVLLRRLPDRVLISETANMKYLKHILRLCEEKNITVEKYPLTKYDVCGIIKSVSDL